jgi:pyridoxamine 5'-phosphate oxidase
MEFSDLDTEPERQIETWLEAARRAGEPLPEAMALATATLDGRPSLRMVLLRGIGDGLVFFTDGESDKGAELRENPRAAAVFHWRVPEHRQVRVSGSAQPVDDAEADRYWWTRQAEARLTAAASHQSQVIPSRAFLDEKIADVARRHGVEDVPRPVRWGGWRLTPQIVEFWQERPGRAHDRLRYRRQGAAWVTERLAP